METNKLIAACAAAVAVASFGIAGEVCAMKDTAYTIKQQVTDMPYNGGPRHYSVNCEPYTGVIDANNGGKYTGLIDVCNDPIGVGKFEYGEGNALEGEFIRGQIAAGKLTFAKGDVSSLEWDAPGGTVLGGRVSYVDGNLEGVYVRGNGTIIYRNGDVFKGCFAYDESVCMSMISSPYQGTLTYAATGDIFEGKFKSGKPWKGTIKCKDGSVKVLIDGQPQ